MAATKGKSGGGKAKQPKKLATPAKAAQSASKKAKPVKAQAKTPLMAEHPEGLFARFNALRDEMDQLFSSMNRSFGFPELKMPSLEFPGRAPMADVRFEVSENDKSLEVRAEVPGLSEDDIDIELSDGLLTIKGEKRGEKEEKKKDYYVRECRYGSFSRSFRVPESVMEDDVNASLEQGVLKVSLPKQASVKRGPKSIKLEKSG